MKTPQVGDRVKLLGAGEERLRVLCYINQHLILQWVEQSTLKNGILSLLSVLPEYVKEVERPRGY